MTARPARRDYRSSDAYLRSYRMTADGLPVFPLKDKEGKIWAEVKEVGRG